MCDVLVKAKTDKKTSVGTCALPVTLQSGVRMCVSVHVCVHTAVREKITEKEGGADGRDPQGR